MRQLKKSISIRTNIGECRRAPFPPRNSILWKIGVMLSEKSSVTLGRFLLYPRRFKFFIRFWLMKVCFITGTLGRGGAEKQLVFMLRALQNAGIESRVLCLTKGES